MGFNLCEDMDGCKSIRLEHGHYLRAHLRNNSGHCIDNKFDLDTCIGCEEGRFHWGGNGFSRNAKNATAMYEGNGMPASPCERDGQVPVLRADLRDSKGKYHDNKDVNLEERIKNVNGHFVFH